MPRICEQAVLSCSREAAFAEMMAIDFINKSQPDVGIEFESTFASERLTRYKRRSGNGNWSRRKLSSQRRSLF
jgi:hypothetical protein